MLLCLLLGLQMEVTEENADEFRSLISTIPAFMFFYSERCGHCRHVHPAVKELGEKFKDDQDVLIAEFNCGTMPCHKFTRVQYYPTFALHFNGVTSKVRLDRTLETFIDVVNSLKSWDPNFKCKRYFNQSDDYPFFIISYDKEQDEACEELQKLLKRMPKVAEPKMLLAQKTEKPKMTVLYDKEKTFDYEGTVGDANIVPFVTDYLHTALGAWNISKQWTLIRYRRLGFFVYNEDRECHRALYTSHYMFPKIATARISSANFQNYDPTFDPTKDAPAFGLFSRDTSHFVLYKNVNMNTKFADELFALIDSGDDSNMTIPFKDFVPNAKKPISKQRVKAAAAPVKTKPKRDPRIIIIGILVFLIIGMIVYIKVAFFSDQRAVRRLFRGKSLASKVAKKFVPKDAVSDV